ncbi:TolB family protein [Lunatimonas salinarum]|uniref:TolB family protein n=1 Tax=Lunatimonas salinarum TaxID=1774590 RepID=UPI001ADFC45E|nr:hypothetical protein [Lunatimonas salinarum]
MKSIKLTKLFFVFALVMLWSCTGDDTSPSDITVTIEATGLSDDKLSVNNFATFRAIVEGGEDIVVRYKWSLSAQRGELTDGVTTMPSPSLSDDTIRCVGRTAGDEVITVEVIDTKNTVVAVASMPFTIIALVDVPKDYGCFDQPKLIYQRGSLSKYVCNFDGSNPQYLGVRGLSVAISPNGRWIAYNDYDDGQTGYFMYLRNCETNETITIPGGDGDDYTPEFSHDSKILYFLRPNPSLEENFASGRPTDLAAYNLETGEDYFVTTLYQSSEEVSRFTVSKVSNEIAFIRNSTVEDSGISPRLSILNPASGLITDVYTLGFGPNSGIDWSPNGEDIIFSSASTTNGRGIFRFNLIDGIGPKLIFSDLSPQSLPPLFPHYYANGTRIAWSGQENGQNNQNIWSIDANGNDLQQITSDSPNETVNGVLE